MLKLQELDYEILYYPGKLNFTADQLSRPPTETSNVEVKTLEYHANIDWEKEQENDKEIAIVRSNLKDEDYECLNFKEFWKKVREKLIVQEWYPLQNKDSESLIVVPSKLVRLICKLNHDSITAGHLSCDRTLQSIANKYVWPEMRANVFDYCSSCDKCQKFKIKNTSNVKPLITIRVGKPWDLVGIDCAGPLKRTKSGKIHFVIAVDYFSKYCMAEATTDTTGETTVNFARDRIVNVFGTPQAFITDQGRNFESQKFKYFCDQNKIKKLRTTAYHPQCNGLTERTIRTIKQMLCMYVNDSHDN